ncbi:MAG TPA: PIN domain-containing protein [Terriglobales bacterium]|jgi:predicted nucleic acid-binding protein|nr:PIN domain-containing protein [Terriglobales bacterium]
MSAVRHFLDTNIFIYTFDLQAPKKAKRAESLIAEALASGTGMISYQVAQEFVAAARKPFQNPMSFQEIERYWQTTLRPLLAVHSSPGLFIRALDLARRDQLSWYDSLIVAAAIQGDCEILYSEDMQHGRRFGDLVIQNPFL